MRLRARSRKQGVCLPVTLLCEEHQRGIQHVGTFSRISSDQKEWVVESLERCLVSQRRTTCPEGMHVLPLKNYCPHIEEDHSPSEIQKLCWQLHPKSDGSSDSSVFKEQGE